MDLNEFNLKIVGQDGWTKSIRVDKAVTRVGSASANDVRIASTRIAAYQLQINYLQESSVCKLLNLGYKVLLAQGEGRVELAPFAVANIQNGDEVILGEYRLQFDLPQAARSIRTSNFIEATLTFQDATLRPSLPTVGTLLIKNAGSQSACQFQVGLSGLPADCMQIDPVPLLYPGAQEEIRVILTHHGLYPLAGPQELTLVISAPESYPGEQVVIQKGIFVSPVLKHSLEIVDDLRPMVPPTGTAATSPEGGAEETMAASGVEPSKPVLPTGSMPVSQTVISSPMKESRRVDAAGQGAVAGRSMGKETGSGSRPEADSASIAEAVPEQPKPKVARKPVGNYWDEEE